MTAPNDDNPTQPKTLVQLVESQGAHVRPLYRAIALLRTGWRAHDELVRTAALPRRTVQELFAALGEDLEHRDVRPAGRTSRITRDAVDKYAGYPDPPALDPLADSIAAHTGALGRIESYVDDVPVPLPALDHVQATPETVLRRALWLDARYDLTRARILLLGDHDLTSLAIREIRPDAELTVVDVDERLLAYVDEHSERSIRTVHADLRVGLPGALAGAFDLVFSDPPYTPEGMALFAARGVESLADATTGRLLLAYGYSVRHPALGAQVQKQLGGLGLTFEAIIPDFHLYLGAEAIGSAADLYVCQPTARAGRKGGKKTGIYTHGPQSVESGGAAMALLADLRALADEPVDVRGPDWSKPISAEGDVAFDLSADPGPWLLRALLATNAGRVLALLPNGHPDIGDAASQAALSSVARGKYRLRFLRSTPDNRHAVVVAEAVDPDEADPAMRAVCARAHGKVLNTAREALVAASDGALTKNEARDRLTPHAAGLDGLRLLDVPRHRIAEILDAIAAD